MFPGEALRARKEAWVSNHHGTTTFPVAAVLALLPALLLLHRAASRVAAELLPAWWRASSRARPGCAAFAGQASYYILPAVLALTVDPRFVIPVGVAACALALAAGLHAGSVYGGGARVLALRGAGALRSHALHALDPARPAFVTHFRGALTLLTGLAVLGVDLAPFPRALAKTEAWGVSLMDAGSGAAAFSVGLAAGAGAGGGGGGGLLAHVAPLLALGAARHLVHAALRLPLHESEYGVHWNFFLTLAAVAVVAHGARAWRVSAPAALAAGWALALAAEAGLLRVRGSGWGAGANGAAGCAAAAAPYYPPASAGHWALCAPRGVAAGLAALNREGLLSLPGYAALCLVGAGVGRLVAGAGARAAEAARAGRAADAPQHWQRLLALLLALAGAQAVAWGALCSRAHAAAAAARAPAPPPGFPASRRLANLPYVLWCGALCTGWLAAWLAVEAVTTRGEPQSREGAIAARLGRAAAAAGALVGGAAAAGGEPPPTTAAAAGAAAAAAAAAAAPQPLHPPAIFAALSDRALLAFVAANLLTGAANAACDAAWGAAHDAPYGAARAILAAQGTAFAGVAWMGKWGGWRGARKEKMV
jgi:phosphatidylinositol glycan class W